MFADNAQISHRQLFRQILIGLLGVFLLAVPRIPELKGRQGILAVFTASGIIMLLSVYFVRVKNSFRYPEKYMGKLGGRLFVLIYLSWLYLAGAWLLCTIARVTGRFLIEGSVSWAVILLAGGAAYLGSRQGLERRGRMAEVCFPVFILVLLSMLFLAFLKIRPVYLEEAGPLTLKGWAAGTWNALSCFLPFLFLPFTLGNVKNPGTAGRAAAGAAAAVGGVLSMSLFLLQGSFSLQGYGHKEYPMFDLMAGVNLPGNFLERIDIFWIAAVVFGLFFALGSVFFYSHELFVRIRSEKAAVFSALGILAAAQVCEAAELSLDFFLEITKTVYAPLFLLLLAAASMKGKWKRAAAVFLCALCPLLSACGVSLERRIFPLSMSVDYRNGNYQIIYGIPELSAVTGQEKEGGTQSKGEAVAYEGKTVEEAQENFNRNQENYLDMGHMKALILGEGILEEKEALAGLLDFLEEKPSVAGNIYVFSCGDNQKLMSLEGQKIDSVGDYLTGILENTLEDREKEAVTLQDFYTAHRRKDRQPLLLEVTVVNNRPQICPYS